MAADPVRLAGGPAERAAGEHVAGLFEQHGRMVYGLCRALLRDPLEAEDATQATFVSAFQALLGGSDVREPAAWLATIARNECGGRAHARMREPLPLHGEDLLEPVSLDGEVERRLTAAELRRAIGELPQKQREAVVLRDLYGMRYDEVGAALGMSLASVESLLFRARRQLRVALKPAVGGALAVPVAVREAIAQALPGFADGGMGGGGVVAGAAGASLIAKLTASPVAAKLALAGITLTAAGGATVAGVEHASRSPAPAPVVAVVGGASSATGMERRGGDSDGAGGRGVSAPRAAGSDAVRPRGQGGGGGGEKHGDDDRRAHGTSSGPASGSTARGDSERSGSLAAREDEVERTRSEAGHTGRDGGTAPPDDGREPGEEHHRGSGSTPATEQDEPEQAATTDESHSGDAGDPTAEAHGGTSSEEVEAPSDGSSGKDADSHVGDGGS